MNKEELYVSSPTSLSIGSCTWVAMDVKLVNAIEKIINENKQLKEKIQELKADYGSKSQVERDLLEYKINKAIKYNKKNIHSRNLKNILEGNDE